MKKDSAKNSRVWLSALDLTLMREGWRHAKPDTSLDGNALTINGRTFPRGVATHAESELILDLKGKAKQFHALVGIDDEVMWRAGQAASVQFLVIGDGKILWRSGLVLASDRPREANVDVRGIKTLTLFVSDAFDGNAFDHADWADAYFEMARGASLPEAIAAPSPRVRLAADRADMKPAFHGAAEVGILTGTPFLHALSVTGRRPIRFSARGLPAGLTMEAATGRITGVVRKKGSWNVQVKAKNAHGATTRRLRIVAGESLALAPPMGWNSWDCFGESLTEAEAVDAGRYMAKHLQPHGWDYLVIDHRWFAVKPNTKMHGKADLNTDEFGRFQPVLDRYPSAAGGKGLKPLADKIHALGLKFGIHVMRGIARCCVEYNTPIFGSAYRARDVADLNSTCWWNGDMYGVDASKPGAQDWYGSIVRQYAEWHVDYIKLDDSARPYSAGEIELFRKALDRCGRSIVLSLSPGETPITSAEHVKQYANLWRICGDLWDHWNALNKQFERAARWCSHAAPGHWPDLDMLPLGQLMVRWYEENKSHATRLSQDEQITLMTLWTMISAPLMMGGSLFHMDPWTLRLLTNDEVLAVDQDTSHVPAGRVLKQEYLEVWSKDLADGSKAIAFFNRGPLPAALGATWDELGLSGRQHVRDLWQHEELGTFNGEFRGRMPRHGALLLRFCSAVRVQRSGESR